MGRDEPDMPALIAKVRAVFEETHGRPPTAGEMWRIANGLWDAPRVTLHGGPFDGEVIQSRPLERTVERAVGFLDVTPDEVVTPRRRVTVTAVYRWDGGDRLDFDRLDAHYHVVDL